MSLAGRALCKRLIQPTLAYSARGGLFSRAGERPRTASTFPRLMSAPVTARTLSGHSFLLQDDLPRAVTSLRTDGCLVLEDATSLAGIESILSREFDRVGVEKTLVVSK